MDAWESVIDLLKSGYLLVNPRNVWDQVMDAWGSVIDLLKSGICFQIGHFKKPFWNSQSRTLLSTPT